MYIEKFSVVEFKTLPHASRWMDEHGDTVSWTYGDAEKTLVSRYQVLSDVEDSMGCSKGDEYIVLLAMTIRSIPEDVYISFDG